jgi:hypothetical protein
VIAKFADSTAATVGRYATLTVQVAPAATLLPHEFAVIRKHPALAPVVATELIANGPVPVFLTVIVLLALVVFSFCVPKARLAGERLTTGAVPVPLSATDCGDPAASSVISRLAVLLPTAVGLNVTTTVRLAPTAMLGPQLFTKLKSPAFAPPIVIELISKAAVPVFFTVMVWLALAVPEF